MNISVNDIKEILKNNEINKAENNAELGVQVATNRNNVVSAETLRKVQSKTLNEK